MTGISVRHSWCQVQGLPRSRGRGWAPTASRVGVRHSPGALCTTCSLPAPNPRLQRGGLGPGNSPAQSGSTQLSSLKANPERV